MIARDANARGQAQRTLVRTFSTKEGTFFLACDVGDADRGPCLRETGWTESRAPAASWTNAPRLWPELTERLKAAIAGEAVDFGDVETPATTPFFAACRRAVQAIPAGTTISYVELARRAGSPRASRAAGQAMRRNPTPIVVPCHRVVTADGRLGGFAGDWSDQRGGADLLFGSLEASVDSPTGSWLTSLKRTLLARERATSLRGRRRG